MRHQKAGKKLGRTASHRMALLRTLATQFFDRERLVTTLPKAKALRPFAEKIITLAKRESLHARRQALAVIRKKAVVSKLFDDLAPRFADRNGGYCRIIRLGVRKGDAAERAVIELIGSEYKPPKVEKKKGGKKEKAEAAETKPVEKAEKAEKAQKAEKPEKKAKKPSAEAAPEKKQKKEKAPEAKAEKPAKKKSK